MRFVCFVFMIAIVGACGTEGFPNTTASEPLNTDGQNRMSANTGTRESIPSHQGSADIKASSADIDQALGGSGEIDKDNDGSSPPWDCDDLNKDIHPEAMESCNEQDDDCDSVVDEGAGVAVYQDQDEDGFGDDSTLTNLCSPAEDAIFEGGDCNDSDPLVYPGSSEVVDGVDSDCDGKKDWLVTIYTAVDDAGEFCVDTEDPMLGSSGGWVEGSSMDLWMKSGSHVLGIHGWDLGKQITAAIAHLETSEGVVLVSDQTWRYDPNPENDGESRLGWCSPDFDDSTWSLVKDIGPIGDSANPWGNSPTVFPDDSPAHWIWDHFPVDLNTQYLRGAFVLP